MANNEAAIYLVTIFDESPAVPGDPQDTERLVNAPSRSKAIAHCFGVNKASAADVARVLGAGGKVEEASA